MKRETSRSVLSPAWRQAVGGEEGGREGRRAVEGDDNNLAVGIPVHVVCVQASLIHVAEQAISP